MAFSERLLTLFLIFLAFAIPAYANNPPQPDGLFSVLLIFPVVILACRIAGLTQTPRRPVVRVIIWIVVGICSVVFLGAGTIIGAFAALLVLIFAIVRASQIMQKSRNAKRHLIGLIVVVLSLLAFVDYYLSIARGHLSTSFYEYAATMRIRNLSEAEQEFAKSRGRPGSQELEFGTMQDLKTADLIREAPTDGQLVRGYRLGEILDPDRKHYLLYAIPAAELKPGDETVEFVPGTALLKVLLGQGEEQGTGRYSFAVDETGEIRQAIRHTTGPVTRGEVTHWEKLQ